MATQRVWLRNKFLRITREFPIRDASLLLADEFPTLGSARVFLGRPWFCQFPALT